MNNTIVHFWDMDHTLIDNDCDVSWKEYLIAKGLAPKTALAQVETYWDQYKKGVLREEEFIQFQLCEFAGRDTKEIQALADDHFATVVRRRIYAEALEIIQELHRYGTTTCMVTATNRAIAQPVADAFGFVNLLATEPEHQNGRYTGNITGLYCIGERKTTCMQAFCRRVGATLANAYYYGDSIADIPVLQSVGHPIAVNPMPALEKTARSMGWEIWRFSSP